MIRGLALTSMLGVVGCSLVIGDIEIPDDDGEAPPADALAALAGQWRVYGLTEAGAFDERVELDAMGGLGPPGEVEPGRVVVGADERFEVALGGAAGAVTGPIDAVGGVGALVGDGLVWAVMVREPMSPRSLPTGWSAVVGLTGGGTSNEISRLVEGGDEGYTETRYLPAGAVSRVVYVDSDPDDPTRRALVPADGVGGDRSLTALGGWAIGVRDTAERLELALVFEAIGEPLPEADVICVGVRLVDGAPEARTRAARLGSTVAWADGAGGEPVAAGGGWALPAGQGFFEDVDTLLLGPVDGRLYAALPIAPPVGEQSAAVSWGLALCLVDDGPPGGGEGDAGVVQLGG